MQDIVLLIGNDKHNTQNAKKESTTNNSDKFDYNKSENPTLYGIHPCHKYLW